MENLVFSDLIKYSSVRYIEIAVLSFLFLCLDRFCWSRIAIDGESPVAKAAGL